MHVLKFVFDFMSKREGDFMSKKKGGNTIKFDSVPEPVLA